MVVAMYQGAFFVSLKRSNALYWNARPDPTPYRSCWMGNGSNEMVGARRKFRFVQAARIRSADDPRLSIATCEVTRPSFRMPPAKVDEKLRLLE
jgi:hypothetical protein